MKFKINQNTPSYLRRIAMILQSAFGKCCTGPVVDDYPIINDDPRGITMMFYNYNTSPNETYLIRPDLSVTLLYDDHNIEFIQSMENFNTKAEAINFLKSHFKGDSIFSGLEDKQYFPGIHFAKYFSEDYTIKGINTVLNEYSDEVNSNKLVDLEG